MRTIAICTLLSLIFVSSCVTIPTDEACCKLIQTPPLDKTTGLALETKSFEAGEFPSSDWWTMFEDPQLTQLICLALDENPTLQKAKARIDAAESEAQVKRSYLFPSIGFGADVNWQYLGKNNFFRAFTPVIPGNITQYEIDVNLHYEFDFWGKHRNIFRGALGIAKAEEAERQSAILVLSTSVAAVYFKLQANLQKVDLLKNQRALFTRLFELTKERQENALDTSLQRLSAEDSLYSINQSLLFAEKMVSMEKHLLHYLIGAGPERSEKIHNISLAHSFSFPLPVEVSTDLIARRPDIMAHIWRVESTAHLVGAAKADFYPRIDLNALGGLNSVFPGKLFSMGSKIAQVLPALHLPLFTAGRIRANLEARNAEFQEQIYAYNDTVLRAVKEVADQIVALRIADETLQIENRLVQNKIATRSLMVSRYKNALSNMLELLQAQEEVLQEQFIQLNLQYERILAAIELIKALGGGYCSEEVPFD